jgi:hypothetical protein
LGFTKVLCCSRKLCRYQKHPCLLCGQPTVRISSITAPYSGELWFNSEPEMGFSYLKIFVEFLVPFVQNMG